MRWGLGRSEKGSASSTDDVQYVQNYPGANEAFPGEAEYDPNSVPCPAHTTERKLLTRIDLHVIPFLALLYWLAFLDRCVSLSELEDVVKGSSQAAESTSPTQMSSACRTTSGSRSSNTTQPL